MSNRAINRILITIISFLCMTICVLILLIIYRPQHITTQGSTSTVSDTFPATEIIPFENDSSEPSISTEDSTPTTPTVPTEDVAKELYAKTTCLLNIRATNSTDAAVVETVSENTILQVLEIQPDGWTKVLYEGQEAYVSSAYIILIQ